jgi:hypothetical protein
VLQVAAYATGPNSLSAPQQPIQVQTLVPRLSKSGRMDVSGVLSPTPAGPQSPGTAAGYGTVPYGTPAGGVLPPGQLHRSHLGSMPMQLGGVEGGSVQGPEDPSGPAAAAGANLYRGGSMPTYMYQQGSAAEGAAHASSTTTTAVPPDQARATGWGEHGQPNSSSSNGGAQGAVHGGSFSPHPPPGTAPRASDTGDTPPGSSSRKLKGSLTLRSSAIAGSSPMARHKAAHEHQSPSTAAAAEAAAAAAISAVDRDRPSMQKRASVTGGVNSMSGHSFMDRPSAQRYPSSTQLPPALQPGSNAASFVGSSAPSGILLGTVPESSPLSTAAALATRAMAVPQSGSGKV